MQHRISKSFSIGILLMLFVPLIITAIPVKAYGPILARVPAEFGNGYIQEIIPGKNLMHLEGTPSQMGYQQGYLGAESVSRLASIAWFKEVVLGLLAADESILIWVMEDVLDYNRLVSVVGSVLTTTQIETVDAESGDTLDMLLDKLFALTQMLVLVNVVYVPQEYIDEMHGVADGATAAGYPVSYENVLLLNMGFDAMLALAYPVVEPLLFWMDLFAFLSCSGFVAKSYATVGGHTIMGRHWQFTSVVTHEEMMMMDFNPAPGYGYRFLSTSCPGFVGVTSAMNNQGLGIGNDMVPAQDCDPAHFGMGTLLTCRYVMQYKAQLTDAINYIKYSVRGCSWIYGIGDGRNGETGGCALETSEDYCYIRSMSYTHPWWAILSYNQIEKKSDLVTYTNHYIYATMNDKADSTIIDDSDWRYKTLTNLALSKYGTLSLETGATLIDYLHPPNYGYYGTDPTQAVGAAVTCWDLTTLQAKALYGHYNDAWVYTSLLIE